MYVVAGATGRTGGVVARALLERGQKVRVLVRSQEWGERLRLDGAEVVVAELGDAKAVGAALRGAHGAYLLVPPTPVKATGIRESRARISEALFQAVSAVEGLHVVLLSSIGAQVAHGTGTTEVLRDAEQRFAALDRPCTFLRAASFVEGWSGMARQAAEQGTFSTFLAPVDRKLPVVSIEDVGTAAARLLLDPARSRRVIELSGPRDVSPADAVAALGRLLGKRVQLTVRPTHAMVETLTGLGYSEELALLEQQLTEAINGGRLVFGGIGAQRIRGTVELDDALRALLPPPA